MISRVNTVVKVFKLSKGYVGYKGNMLNIEQDAQSVIDKLSLAPKELPIFVVRKNTNCNGSNY